MVIINQHVSYCWKHSINFRTLFEVHKTAFLTQKLVYDAEDTFRNYFFVNQSLLSVALLSFQFFSKIREYFRTFRPIDIVNHCQPLTPAVTVRRFRWQRLSIKYRLHPRLLRNRVANFREKKIFRGTLGIPFWTFSGRERLNGVQYVSWHWCDGFECRRCNKNCRHCTYNIRCWWAGFS